MIPIYLPFRGELGHKVMWHAPSVNHFSREKIVCIEPGDEALYPNAIKYIQVERKNDDRRRYRPRDDRAFLEDLVEELKLDYPQDQYRFIPPKEKAPRSFFKPIPYKDYEVDCDIVVCPRRRNYGSNRNWGHWEWIIDKLMESGLKIFAAGAPDSSLDVNCPRAWDYERYLDATISAIHSSRYILSTDTGLAHLGLMCGSDVLMIVHEGRPSPATKWKCKMRRFREENHLNAEHCLLDHWFEPEKVFDIVVGRLES